MKTPVFVASLLLTSSLAAAPVAAKPAGEGRGRPCAADAQRLCPGVQREGGALRACMAEHKADLGPACQARLESKGRLKGACKADRAEHCAGVKGKAAVAACLTEHKASLAPLCAEKLERHAKKREAAAVPAVR
jgi:hypothetical protein